MAATDLSDDLELDELARLIAAWVSSSMRMTRRNDGIKAMADLGLTFPQLGALHILLFEGAMAVTTLTEKLALSLSATSHLVQRLVEAELVTRVEHDSDRRQKVLSLSPKGHELMDTMMKARLKEFRSSVEHLKPQLRRELKDVLQKIVDDLGGLHDQRLAGACGQFHGGFRGAKLEGADLSGKDLAGADFTNANLQRADLSGAQLANARFTGANLAGADLSGAQLVGVDFTNANLEGADLGGADIKDAIFHGANLPAGFKEKA